MNFRGILRGRLGRAVWALCLAGLPASSFGGGRQVCSGGDFFVDAPSPELGREICGNLTEAAEMMAACGLKQTKPLAVEIVPGISHPMGQCLAYFDCEYDLIKVTDPAAYPRVLPAENPYSLLPPTVVLRSLLTHELAHALTMQTAGKRLDIVDQEYIAAALELEFLDEEWRTVLVQAAPVSLPPKPGLIDIWIYGLEPRKFATNAWQHFRTPGAGCSLIMEIAGGQFSFAK